MSSWSESELIEACQAGNNQAWDELFDRYYAPVTRFIFQISSAFTREDAQEIAQEVFLTVIRSLGKFAGRSQFQTWLFRIASNKAHDYIEKQQAKKRGSGKLVSLSAVDQENERAVDPPSGQPSPDLELMSAELSREVTEAMHSLGSPCRELIELKFYADLSYAEIAEVTRSNAKTVSSRLSRCLDRLELLFKSGHRAKTTVFPTNLL